MVVLDTCVLISWTLDAARLSSRAVRACRRAESAKLVLSSISIWEIGIKAKRGLLDLGTTLEDFVARLKSTGSIEIVPVSEAIWMRNVALPWEHRDPTDRTIVATALERRAAIVTPDREIQRFYKRTIW